MFVSCLSFVLRKTYAMFVVQKVFNLTSKSQRRLKLQITVLLQKYKARLSQWFSSTTQAVTIQINNDSIKNNTHLKNWHSESTKHLRIWNDSHS